MKIILWLVTATALVAQTPKYPKCESMDDVGSWGTLTATRELMLCAVSTKVEWQTVTLAEPLSYSALTSIEEKLKRDLPTNASPPCANIWNDAVGAWRMKDGKLQLCGIAYGMVAWTAPDIVYPISKDTYDAIKFHSYGFAINDTCKVYDSEHMICVSPAPVKAVRPPESLAAELNSMKARIEYLEAMEKDNTWSIDLIRESIWFETNWIANSLKRRAEFKQRLGDAKEKAK